MITKEGHRSQNNLESCAFQSFKVLYLPPFPGILSVYFMLIDDNTSEFLWCQKMVAGLT